MQYQFCAINNRFLLLDFEIYIEKYIILIFVGCVICRI